MPLDSGFPITTLPPRWSDHTNDYSQVGLFESLICQPNFIVLIHQEVPNSRDHQNSAPSPNFLHSSRIRSSHVSDVSRICVCSSHQVSSRSLHSKRFPRFPVPPSNSPRNHGIRSGFQLGHLRHEVFPHIKFHEDPITRSKVINISRFRIPPFRSLHDDQIL